MGQSPEDWVIRHLPGGGSVPVRPGSPVDAVFGAADPGAGRTMELSLGYLGDLVWLRLPEARPLVADQVARELDDAMAMGRELRHPTALNIVSDVLWTPLLRRLLESSPLDRELLARCLAVIREAYTSEESNDEVRDALLVYVMDGLRAPDYLSIVEDVDRELFEIIEG